MSDDELGDAMYEPEGEAPSRHWNVWIGLALLAFATYELTSQAPLSLAIVCIKFGMNDLSTGVWLRRRDPWKFRGKACFWFYTALGLAKASMTAFVGIIACMILLAHQQQLIVIRKGPAPEPPHLFIEGAFVMLFAALAATFCICVGLMSALRGRARLWIGSIPAADRRDDIFPPVQPGPNRANLLIVGTFTIIGFSAFTALLIWLLQGQPRLNVGLGLSVAFAVLALIVVAGICLAGRVCAQQPAECWGVDP